MKTLVECLREEADDTHKNWYRVASDEQREQCRALTLEAADRIASLEAALRKLIEHLLNTVYGASDSVIIAARSALETACTCDSTLVTDTSTHQPHCPRYVAETTGKPLPQAHSKSEQRRFEHQGVPHQPFDPDRGKEHG